jgi:hypothetical protein
MPVSTGLMLHARLLCTASQSRTDIDDASTPASEEELVVAAGECGAAAEPAAAAAGKRLTNVLAHRVTRSDGLPVHGAFAGVECGACACMCATGTPPSLPARCCSRSLLCVCADDRHVRTRARRVFRDDHRTSFEMIAQRMSSLYPRAELRRRPKLLQSGNRAAIQYPDQRPGHFAEIQHERAPWCNRLSRSKL